MKKDPELTPQENADEQLDQLIEEITGKIKILNELNVKLGDSGNKIKADQLQNRKEINP
jgi:uncharacterized protein YfkK (UPF0435 family)